MSDSEILTQDEKDTLLKGIPDDQTQDRHYPAKGQVVAYDFKHPAHKLKAHLPLLEVVNDKFRKNFSVEMTTMLRQPVTVTVSDFSTHKYQEYTHSLPEGVSINRVQLNPLPGTSLICLDPTLVFTLVDSFFGGNGQPTAQRNRQDFTPTELRLVERTIECAFRALKEAWKNIYEISPEFLRAELNTQVTSPANPSEVMLTSKFKMALSLGDGEFHIAIPYSTLEPIRPYLKAAIDKPEETNSAWSQNFKEMVLDSPLEVQSIIAETPITFRQLIKLQTGDFIPLNQSQQATFFAEQIPLFNAVIGASNGMISAKIIEYNRHRKC
ncbi:MAG TPA: flagellar motor switch protein FliM [Gammaproteobacteria bacterium]|nr:flagellar motor switch protein FliM [Gammaproteobacteria bacterium]